jgi:hypothetical protein
MRTAALGLASARPSSLDDLARAMTFIATGDEQNLARALERSGTAQDDPVGTEVVLPLIKGLRAYWRGDFADAIDLIESAAPSFGRLSEFTDQVSVFRDTLESARSRILELAGTPGARPRAGSPLPTG